MLLGGHLRGEGVCRHASLPLSPQVDHVLLQRRLVLPLRVEALGESLLLLLLVLGAKEPDGEVAAIGRLLL